MKKYSNGILVDMNQEDLNIYNQGVSEEQANAFSNSMERLRNKRNNLLAQTDYIVIKAKETGTTIPTAWKTYRQALRDITQGLTTVEEVELVIFPEKP